ncbi:hypothetical protein ACOME3_000299 [Neoechinorhynchus agilis]
MRYLLLSVQQCFSADKFEFKTVFNALCSVHGVGDASHIRELKQSIYQILQLSGQLICVLAGRSSDRIGRSIFRSLAVVKLPLNAFTYRLVLSGMYILNGGVTTIQEIENASFPAVNVNVLRLLQQEFLDRPDSFECKQICGMLCFVYGLSLRYFSRSLVMQLEAAGEDYVDFGIDRDAFSMLTIMCKDEQVKSSSNISQTLHALILTYITLMPFHFEVVFAQNSKAFKQLAECMQCLYDRFPLLANDYWLGLRIPRQDFNEEVGWIFTATGIIEHIAQNVNSKNVCIVADTLKVISRTSPDAANHLLTSLDPLHNLLARDRVIYALVL